LTAAAGSGIVAAFAGPHDADARRSLGVSLTHRLKSSFEHDAHQREDVSHQDIHLSRLTGLAPADVDVLCDFSREEGLLLVIRCPKRPARYFQGKAAPKPLEVKT
jgi:hypothetical protein